MKYKFKTPVMQDTPMDLNPDPMVIPTLATFKSWGGYKSFALDLKGFIEYMLDNPDTLDSMDSRAIY